jgi:hypothetical protein
MAICARSPLSPCPPHRRSERRLVTQPPDELRNDQAAPPRSLLLATAVALCCTASVASAQSAKAAQWKVPRTEHGHPDLQGVWTNATITPLERPERFGGRLVITDEESRQLEGAEAAYNDQANAPSDLSKPADPTCRSGSGPTCGYNNFWIDRGHAVATINGEKRSSLLVDPPDGKLPALTPERQKVLGQRMRGMRQNFDGPEVRPLGERCLLAFGSSSGPPMLPVLYNNHYQIVQTRDTVMILVEMVHDVRVVRLNGKPVPAGVRKWMGDSIGRWEGNTLVVETTGLTDKEGFRGATPDAKIIERFTRTGPEQIVYRFTIDDPQAFTRPFSGEIPLHATDDPIYEYACHEGNYALPGILAGAREEEKAKSAAH